MNWKPGLLAVCLVASSAQAESEKWTDPYFGKNWELTPNGQEVVLLYEPGFTPSQRHTFELRESLTLVHAFHETYRTAVYELAPEDNVAELRRRTDNDLAVRGIAPVVIDHEGFTKYYVPGQLTIQFDRGMDDAECRLRIAQSGSLVLHDYWTPGFYKIEVPTQADVFAELRDWNRSAEILFSEPVYMSYNDGLYTPNDPLYPNQWHLNNPGTGPWDVAADVHGEDAWDITTGDPNVLVVIIDTGLDMDHEDLFDRVIPRDGHDWDFSGAGEIPEDTGNHGTACAGIAVASQDNAIGVSGIAPSCSLMPLKISLNSGQNANRADAINYAASRRSEFDGLVMSNSWRMSSGDFTAVEAAVENAWDSDCVALFSSGNGNSNIINYPARYDGAIAVGATSPCDERTNPSSCDGESWWGSDYGAEQEVMAPGVLIQTTDREGPAGYSPGNYAPAFNGTSAACPLAAGVAALIYSANPALSNAEVREILQASSDDEVGPAHEDSPGWDMFFGYGRVNARTAVEMAAVTDTFEDDMETADGNWTVTGLGFGVDGWHIDDRRNHTEGGQLAYRCGAEDDTPYSGRINTSLTSPPVQVTDSAVLTFWHYIDSAELDDAIALDGGRVEVSTNGGSNWDVLIPETGYTHVWGDHPGEPFDTGDAVFSGSFDWRPAFVDLAAYNGEVVQVRFHFGSRDEVDPEQAGEGWYIDDVSIAQIDPASSPPYTQNGVGFRLRQNFPNPFAEKTEIEFRLAESARVQLDILDAQGRRVRSSDLGMYSAGRHRFFVDTAEESGRRLPAGVYFYRLATSGDHLVRSMTVMK